MKNKFSKKNILIFSVALAFVGITLIGLEKTQVTDFYKKPENRNPQSGQQVASGDPAERKIDNSPATKQDNEAVNQQKESDPKSTGQETPNATSTSLQVVLNRAYLDAGQVKVRSTVYGTTAGSCKAVLTKKTDGTSFTSSVVAVNHPTADYACSPININTSSLSSGTWSVSVMLESGGKTAQSQSQEVTVP